MDHGSFDRFTRLLGSAGSRRAALGALLGTGVAGTLGLADAAKKNRKKRKGGKHGKGGSAYLTTEAADCLSPGPSSNISECDYTLEDFSGQDLSSSRMVKTIFRNGNLVKTDLSSSNAKQANFRDADLCGADLSSSTLRQANFRNANLTKADLSSSGCGGANFTGTTFCQTIDCNGDLDNSDCAGVNAALVCCETADCPAGFVCQLGPNRCCASNGTVIGNRPATLCCSTCKMGGICTVAC